MLYYILERHDATFELVMGAPSGNDWNHSVNLSKLSYTNPFRLDGRASLSLQLPKDISMFVESGGVTDMELIFQSNHSISHKVTKYSHPTYHLSVIFG